MPFDQNSLRAWLKSLSDRSKPSEATQQAAVVAAEPVPTPAKRLREVGALVSESSAKRVCVGTFAGFKKATQNPDRCDSPVSEPDDSDPVQYEVDERGRYVPGSLQRVGIFYPPAEFVVKFAEPPKQPQLRDQAPLSTAVSKREQRDIDEACRRSLTA